MLKIAGLIVLLTQLAGCGWYTNVPAQMKLAHAEGGEKNQLAGTITYKVAKETISVTVQNPKIIIEGEAGSIGVTFNQMRIDYLPTGVMDPITVAASIRLPSSHQFDKDKKLLQGRTEVELPVISSKVVDLGNPLRDGRINHQISAQVTLTGTDDAQFPALFEVFVPINFVTSDLPRS